jgi:hypothetical protein
MLFVAYLPKEGNVMNDTLVAVFLMEYDAKVFMKNSHLSTLRIKEVDDWTSWSSIRKSAFEKEE